MPTSPQSCFANAWAKATLQKKGFEFVKTTSALAVIASDPRIKSGGTKQSRGRGLWPLDCFAPLAITAEGDSIILPRLLTDDRWALSLDCGREGDARPPHEAKFFMSLFTRSGRAKGARISSHNGPFG